MFKMFENLTKAAISVAVTPITIAADALMLPIDASDDKVGNRTIDTLKNAQECLKEATKPK